jgi:hypothetical protein
MSRVEMPDFSDDLTRWALVSLDRSEDLRTLLRIGQSRLIVAMESAIGENVVRILIERYPDSRSRLRERILSTQLFDSSDSISLFAAKKTMEVGRLLYKIYRKNRSTTGDDHYMMCFRDFSKIYSQIIGDISETLLPIERDSETERDLKEWTTYWRDCAASWTRPTGGTLFHESIMHLCEALGDLSVNRLVHSSYLALKAVSTTSAYLQLRGVYPDSSVEYDDTWCSTLGKLVDRQLHGWSVDLEAHFAQSRELDQGDRQRIYDK